jgi:hypothetical protein
MDSAPEHQDFVKCHFALARAGVGSESRVRYLIQATLLTWAVITRTKPWVSRCTRTGSHWVVTLHRPAPDRKITLRLRPPPRPLTLLLAFVGG